jgi:CxxC-x17-CxxC domain-containing protein
VLDIIEIDRSAPYTGAIPETLRSIPPLPARRSCDVPHADRILICRDCSASFTFSAGEQSFYAERGLLNQPQRCPGCRSARRHDAGGPALGGYVHYGAFASFGGRSARQMHPALCSKCGQMTEVPFIPKEGRPVFCFECFGLGRERTAPSRMSAFP